MVGRRGRRLGRWARAAHAGSAGPGRLAWSRAVPGPAAPGLAQLRLDRVKWVYRPAQLACLPEARRDVPLALGSVPDLRPPWCSRARRGSVASAGCPLRPVKPGTPVLACAPAPLGPPPPDGAVPPRGPAPLRGAVPRGAPLRGAVPRGAVPRGALPRGALPRGAVPRGAVPRGAAVPGGPVPWPGGPVPCCDVPCGPVPGGPVPCGPGPFGPGPRGPGPCGPAVPNGAVPGLAGSALPPRSAGGSGRTRPSATTSLASLVRRFGPSGIRNFWYRRSRCCLTAASVTTRSAAISLAVAGATNASSDSAGRHSEVSTSSSRRVSSGAADLRSSTSGAMSSCGTPPTLQRAAPKLTTSPSSRTRRATGLPFTRVPFLDNPRSTTYVYGPRLTISACSWETLGSPSRTSTALPRPTVVTSDRSGKSSPLSSIFMNGPSKTDPPALSEPSRIPNVAVTLRRARRTAFPQRYC
jgi:hypothetical protein